VAGERLGLLVDGHLPRGAVDRLGAHADALTDAQPGEAERRAAG